MPNIIQSYSNIQGLTNVYCSNLIHYNDPIPSFHKIVYDYNTATDRETTISFKHREFHFSIYKYIKYKYFKNSIKKNKTGGYDVSLTFVTPDNWNDPFESVFYKSKIHINKKTYYVTCFCATLEPTESEESAWNRNIYSAEDDEKTIRVSYEFMSFCKFLERIGKEKGLSFYLSIANYSLSRSSFKKRKTSYTSLDDYLNDLSKKRKAFAYENEMRVFAVKNRDMGDIFTIHANILESDLTNLVKSVTLPPYPPINKKSEKSKFYSQIQDLDNFGLRTGIMNIINNKLSIKQCRLYELYPSKNSSFINKLIRKC